MTDLEVVVDGLGFVEAPRWRDGKLWFSDFYARTVLTAEPTGEVERVTYVPGQPSGIGFSPDGALMIVSSHDGHLLRLYEGATSILADIGAMYRGALNDMVVDSYGRCYISMFPVPTVGPGTVQRPPSPDTVSIPLIRVDPNGAVTVVADGLKIPNGMAITSDGSQLLVAETYGNCITAFDVASDGSLDRRRIFADLVARRPDGICLDASGAVWVGSFATEEFLRVREGGEIIEIIETPGRWAVSCALGGVDGRDLYCATVQLGPDDYQNGRGHGRIERTHVDVAGVRDSSA